VTTIDLHRLPVRRVLAAVVVLGGAGLAGCTSSGDARSGDARSGDARTLPVLRSFDRTVAADDAPSIPLAALAAMSAGRIDDLRVGEVAHPAIEELRVWNSPGYRRQIARSYRGDSDVVPTLEDRDERKLYDEVLGLLPDGLEEARTRLGRAIDGGSSAVLDYTLGNIYFQLEEFDDAIEAYEAAIAKFPNYRQAYENLGLAHVRKGDLDGALPALTQVIELGGNKSVTWGLIGFAYAAAGNSLNAETAYRMAMMLDPEENDWKEGFARSLFRQGRFSEAAAFMDGLIAAEPESARLWLLQANAYIGLDEPMKAATNYEFVDALGASTPDSLLILADIYVNEEFFDVAVNTYIRALEMEPGRGPDRALKGARVIAGRGAFFETRRLLDGVETVFGESLDPQQRKEMLRLRSQVAVAEGASEEQVALLEEIVALDPLDGAALVSLGQYHQSKGDAEQAIFYYERAQAIPDSEADACVRHAQLLVQQRKFTEAVDLLKRAQRVQPRQSVEDFLRDVEQFARTNR